MTLPADYHMHTPLCRHAVGEPVEYAARAVELGLTEIGFSDHSPMPQDDFDDWRMRAADLEEYIAKVQRARDAFPQLSIKIALEVDYLSGQEGWIRELAARYPWDYLIGSVHYIDPPWAIDNPNVISEWKRRDVNEIWAGYFQRLTQAAASGLFDIIGHADLCKKFGFYPTRDVSALFQPFLAAAKQSNTAIELNTAGLRKECREIYPSPELLRMARSMDVAITFGSDAHAPAEVGMNFAEAIALARACGYSQYLTFAGRRERACSF